MAPDKQDIWKYCYWFDDQGVLQVKKELREKGIEMTPARQNPCEALRGQIGCAEPPVWDVICKHDAAPWYHASSHDGKHLVVSSFALSEEYDQFLETTIEPASFAPPPQPSAQERASLAGDSEYRAHQPTGWGAFPREMGDAIVQGLAKMTDAPEENFDDLLQTWTAVHANFVTRRYRAGADCGNAPYSIADTAHISSCCVELFNLLGSPEPALLVRPCIGAVIVKVLEKDRYYRVTLQKK
jgi:hypothetical protein